MRTSLLAFLKGHGHAEYFQSEVKDDRASLKLHNGTDTIEFKFSLHTPSQREEFVNFLHELMDAVMETQAQAAKHLSMLEERDAIRRKLQSGGTSSGGITVSEPFVPWTGVVTYTKGLPENVKIVKTDKGWFLGVRDGLPPITDNDPGDEV